jgi:CheY-like chemotaxis protein
MGTEERANTPGQSILLVEDDEGIARMLHFSLASAGFEITWVTTGADALHVLEQGRAQAVILDPGLPDNLGGAVLEWLRRSHPNGFPVTVLWGLISSANRSIPGTWSGRCRSSWKGRANSRFRMWKPSDLVAEYGKGDSRMLGRKS